MTATLKKRPWLQMHLSTAIVLMFTAGAIIWANVTPRIFTEDKLPFDRAGEVSRINLDSFKLDIARIKYYYSLPFNQIEADEDGNTVVKKSESPRSEVSSEVSIIGYGWPRIAMTNLNFTFVGKENSRQSIDSWRVFSGYGALGVDVIVGMGALFAAWFGCEWRIRRRTSQKD